MAVVMVAEDDHDLQFIWQRAFERADFEVVLAVNGQQAIDYLSTHTLPDVLILDYDMPVKNGLHVLEALNGIDPDHGLTVVMITANHQVQQAAQQYGVDLFLVKPIDLEQVVRFIERLTHQLN